MMTFGGALIGFAAVLIGIVAQLYIYGKISPLGIIILGLLGIVSFVSGLSLGIIGLITDRNAKRLKVLKPHFEEMRTISSFVIPRVTISAGKIDLSNGSLMFPLDFIAHFPQESIQWNHYCLDIAAHNDKYSKIRLTILEFFQSHRLKVINVQASPESPCIYETIVDPLFVWWKDRAEHSKIPQIDFTKISPNVGNNLYVNGWGAFIAYAENEVDREKCKDVITLLTSNAALEKEATALIVSGQKLVESIFVLKLELMKTIQEMDTYWPGNKDHQFKRMSECKTCGRLL